MACDVRTAQCEDGTVKCEKKVKEPPNVTKELSHVMLEHDVGTAQCEDETVKCEKKVRKPPNVTKELSYMILEPHNVRMELSNVKKNGKGTTKCEK